MIALTNLRRVGAVVAQQPHKLQVGGAIPSLAPNVSDSADAAYRETAADRAPARDVMSSAQSGDAVQPASLGALLAVPLALLVILGTVAALHTWFPRAEAGAFVQEAR